MKVPLVEISGLMCSVDLENVVQLKLQQKKNFTREVWEQRKLCGCISNLWHGSHKHEIKIKGCFQDFQERFRVSKDIFRRLLGL